tara:strand:+ start:14589 stop:15422 length:834 start_codon:yes stop_codon:yes gene_type:complete
VTYYRRRYGYQQTGWADDPDELHREFHRVTSALSSFDQNSVGVRSLNTGLVRNATSADHTGLSDFRAEFSQDFPRDDDRSGSMGVTSPATHSGDSAQGYVTYFSTPSPAVSYPGHPWAVQNVSRVHRMERDSGRWFRLAERDASLLGAPQYKEPLKMRVNPSLEGPWLVAATVSFSENSQYVGGFVDDPWRAVCEFRVSTSTGQSIPGRAVATLGHRGGEIDLREATPLFVSTTILPPGKCDLRIEYRITWNAGQATAVTPNIWVTQAQMFAIGLLR